MGKGDRKTKRGKIWRGTFGVRRPRPSASTAGTEQKSAPKKKTTKKKKTKK